MILKTVAAQSILSFLCLSVLAISASLVAVRTSSDLRVAQTRYAALLKPTDARLYPKFFDKNGKVLVPKFSNSLLIVTLQGPQQNLEIEHWQKKLPDLLNNKTAILGICGDAECEHWLASAGVALPFPVAAYVSYSSAANLAYYVRHGNAVTIDRYSRIVGFILQLPLPSLAHNESN